MGTRQIDTLQRKDSMDTPTILVLNAGKFPARYHPRDECEERVFGKQINNRKLAWAFA